MAIGCWFCLCWMFSMLFCRCLVIVLLIRVVDCFCLVVCLVVRLMFFFWWRLMFFCWCFLILWGVVVRGVAPSVHSNPEGLMTRLMLGFQKPWMPKNHGTQPGRWQALEWCHRPARSFCGRPCQAGGPRALLSHVCVWKCCVYPPTVPIRKIMIILWVLRGTAYFQTATCTHVLWLNWLNLEILLGIWVSGQRVVSL